MENETENDIDNNMERACAEVFCEQCTDLRKLEILFLTNPCNFHRSRTNPETLLYSFGGLSELWSLFGSPKLGPVLGAVL